MSAHIEIRRVPYEEPHHLQLQVQASNGRQTLQSELYINARDLLQLAIALEAFPTHQSDTFLYELGSEKTQERWGYYFLFKVFMTDPQGHCAIQFRFNNNCELPDRELAEFCIKTEVAQINRLGQLFRSFSELSHEVLYWSDKESFVMNSEPA